MTGPRLPRFEWPSHLMTLMVSQNLSLLERLEIAHERVQISVGQLHGRHERTRFDGVRVLDPHAKVFFCIFGRACRDGAAAHQVRKIGTEAPRCIRSADGVTVHAGGGFETAPAGGLLLILNRRLFLSADPDLERLWALHGHS